MTRSRLTQLLAGVVYLAIFFAIGRVVSPVPPAGFDRSGLALFGEATPLATFASESGLFPVYLGISIVALVAGVARRAFLPRALFLVSMLLLTWKIGDVAKLYFHRARPAHWLWVHESSPSYASGHAALAIAGYGLLAAYAWRSALPARERTILAGALVLWIATIDWSRLALGAHWITDLIGGTLLALGLIALGRAVYDPFAGPSRFAIRRNGERARSGVRRSR